MFQFPFSSLPDPPCPPNVQTFSEVTTSKQPWVQLWGKRLSVKTGNDRSFELHSTQSIEMKLLLSYVSIRRSWQWLPWSLIDIWVGGYCLLLLFTQQETAVYREVPGTPPLLFRTATAGRCVEPGSATDQLHRLGASTSLLRNDLHHPSCRQQVKKPAPVL